MGNPGPRGGRGARGERGDPVAVSPNWRQCSWFAQNDGKDSGEVFVSLVIKNTLVFRS